MRRLFFRLAVVSISCTAFSLLIGHSDAALQYESVNHTHTHEKEFVHLTKDQIQKFDIKTQKATPGEVLVALTARGRIALHPDGLAHIIPKVSGVVRAAYKNIGNAVKVGDLMADLESRDIAEVKAGYLSALSKERLNSSVLEREQRLFQEKVSPEQDYLNAKNVYEETYIGMQLARQKLHAFGLSEEDINLLSQQTEPDLPLYQIRSPINGTVVMRHITVGENVENTTTIYEVADLSKVWVEIGIYPKDIYKVHEGQTVEVINPQDNEITEAKLIYVSPIVADETITSKAIAEIDNSNGLWKPGIFVTVNIGTEQSTVPVAIPWDAVQTTDGVDYIFVATPEGFEKREIEIGNSSKELVEVHSGLAPGEEYVYTNTFLLKAQLEKGSADHER